MKWQGRRKSSNVKKASRSPLIFGGGFDGIVFILIYFLLGGNPANLPQESISQNSSSGHVTEKQETLQDFLSVVLADTEDVWHEKFNEYNLSYKEPQMNLFSGSVQSSCGTSSSQMGPFYCPIDETVYIDVSFYNDLKNTFGASGDFAFAYVLAHEVGHHVQNQLGILEQINPLRDKLSETEYNKYSVATELQADYLAGVFAYYIKEKGYLEKGDIEEAMNAASAIGDDRIQKMSKGEVNTDGFTHGSSKSRKDAFNFEFENHDLEHSMTFYENLEFKPEL